MADDIDPTVFEQKMWAEVDALAAAQAALDEAEKRLREQREIANRAMTNYHAALGIDGRRVSRETIRKLYWENPALLVTPIAEAFAIKGGANQVPAVAGPSPETYPCPGTCGGTVRKTARKAKINRCPSCQAEYDRLRAESFAQSAEQAEECRRQRDEWYKGELLAGKTIDELYVERTAPYDGDGRVYAHIQQLADELFRDDSPNVF